MTRTNPARSAAKPAAKAPTPPKPELTDSVFNPWRVPADAAGLLLCDRVRKAVEEHEQRHSLRKRNRRKADQDAFRQTVTALVCDTLHYAALTSIAAESLAAAAPVGGNGKNSTQADQSDNESGIHISLSNTQLGTRDRYRHPSVMTQALPDIAKRMADCGFISLEKGFKGDEGLEIPSKQTTIKATAALIHLAAECGVPLLPPSFTLDNTGRESIVLRRERECFEGGDLNNNLRNISYPKDTPTSRRYRDEMTAINAWLHKAPMELTLPAPVHGQFEAFGLRYIDPTRRFLRRCFTLSDSRFKHGGRLYGGFWQNMDKDFRLPYLTIAGEAVCELDYGQISPRLLYATIAKQPIPPAVAADCYAIPGYEHYREGIKTLLNSAFFMDAIPHRFPGGSKKLFAPHTKATDVAKAILAAHEPLAVRYLFKDSTIGHRLQNIESEIMVNVLLRLMKDSDIPAALPIHDAIIVPISALAKAREVMHSVYHERTGVEAIVTVDHMDPVEIKDLQ